MLKNECGDLAVVPGPTKSRGVTWCGKVRKALEYVVTAPRPLGHSSCFKYVFALKSYSFTEVTSFCNKNRLSARCCFSFCGHLGLLSLFHNFSVFPSAAGLLLER